MFRSDKEIYVCLLSLKAVDVNDSLKQLLLCSNTRFEAIFESEVSLSYYVLFHLNICICEYKRSYTIVLTNPAQPGSPTQAQKTPILNFSSTHQLFFHTSTSSFLSVHHHLLLLLPFSAT